MPTKKIVIILIVVIAIGILVPVFLLTRGPIDTTPPTLSILSPTNTTYFSQTTQITINLNCPDSDVDTIWYRLYNETDGSWVDPTNITWTSSIPKILGKGGVYILYAWANDTHGLISSTATVTFTMIHELIYFGDQIFASTFTVDTYQKVIFQDGAFSFTSGSLLVYGILEMANVTWTSALTMDTNSAVSITNCTFNGYLQTYGNLVASFNNVTFWDDVYLRDNSSISMTGAEFNDYVRAYEYTKLTITDSSLFRFRFDDYSEVNISYCTCSSYGYLYDYSSVMLKNFTSSSDIYHYGNTSLLVINSTIYQIFDYTRFDSGNWLIDYNTISGTGSYTKPTTTVIDSTIGYTYTPIEVYSTTNLLINNSIYSWITIYDNSNVILCNTTFSDFYAFDFSNVTILNSIINVMQFRTNGTIYLEDVTSAVIYHRFEFYQGTISGYNETFIGAESWSFPKITMGPNVIYTNYLYQYNVQNQVKFTLTNTSQVSGLYARISSNVSVYYCNMPNVYVYAYQDANITFYYSCINTILCQTTTNATLFNSTCNRAYLYSFSFVSVIAESHINDLYLYDDASYYLSPDSTIDNIH